MDWMETGGHCSLCELAKSVKTTELKSVGWVPRKSIEKWSWPASRTEMSDGGERC